MGYMGFFQTVSDKIPLGNTPGSVSGKDRYVPITPIKVSELRQDAIKNGFYLEDGALVEARAKQLSTVLTCDDKLQKLLTS